MFKSKLAFVSASAFAVAALIAGCQGHDEEEPGHADADVEACGHMKGGPAAPLTAAAAFSATAPAVSNDHKRYDLTLAGTAGARVGFVSFAVARAAEYIVYTGAPVKLALKTAAMTEVAAESSASSVAACTEVKGRHAFDLGVGTYVLGFGPETVDTVSLVLEAQDHENTH